MTRSEIDAMMRELPSQQPRETTADKILVAVAFVLFVLTLMFI